MSAVEDRQQRGEGGKMFKEDIRPSFSFLLSDLYCFRDLLELFVQLSCASRRILFS